MRAERDPGHHAGGHPSPRPRARFGSGCGRAPVAPLPPPRRTPSRNASPSKSRPFGNTRSRPPLGHHQCVKVGVSQVRKSWCLLTPTPASVARTCLSPVGLHPYRLVAVGSPPPTDPRGSRGRGRQGPHPRRHRRRSGSWSLRGPRRRQRCSGRLRPDLRGELHRERHEGAVAALFVGRGPPAHPARHEKGGAALTLAGRDAIGAGFALPRDAGRRPAQFSRWGRKSCRAPSGCCRSRAFAFSQQLAGVHRHLQHPQTALGGWAI